MQGLGAANIGAWPVLLAVYTGKPRDKKRTTLTYLAKALHVKKARMAQYICEFHNRGLIVVHVTRTLRDVPIQTNEQTNEQTKNYSSLAVQELFNLWNAHCGSLPQVRKLTRSLSEKIKLRLSEEPDLAYWETAIKNLAASEFCQSGGWANFHWLTKNDTNHAKAFANSYANKPRSDNRKAGFEQRTTNLDDELAEIEARVKHQIAQEGRPNG